MPLRLALADKEKGCVEKGENVNARNGVGKPGGLE